MSDVAEEYQRMVQRYQEVLTYVRPFIQVGRPKSTASDSPADQANFIQAMRKKGFVNETEEELISLFESAKSQIINDYNSMF